MRIMLSFAAALALAASTLPALAHAPARPRQTTPRGVKKQAKADRKLERAHRVQHGESLRREPKLVREEDHLAHKQRHPKN